MEAVADPVQATLDTWLGLALTDEHDAPMGDVAYELAMNDGSVQRGTLDGEGRARLEGLSATSCDVRFPDLEPEYVITRGRALLRDDSVSIDIVDENGRALDGEPYELRLPDGTSIAGTVEGGQIRIEHLGWAGAFDIVLPNVTRGVLRRDAAEG
ncbi:MAG: hypothetical protein R3B40_29350 [Polyangiales bacterium]